MENHPSSVPARSSSSSSSKNQELANKERQEVAADDVIIKIPSGRMYRVPSHIRENKKHIYDPVIISIGPYHYGKRDLVQGEKLKDDILNKILASPEDKDLFRGQIREKIGDIRHLYEGLDKRNKRRDDRFADLMVRDACFVLYFMKGVGGDMEAYQVFRRIGHSRTSFLKRDIMMLENQIPLWVIKLLVNLIFKDKIEWEALLCKFLEKLPFVKERLEQVPWENVEEALHLPEAYWMALRKHEHKSTEVDKVDCISSVAQRLHHLFQPLLRRQRTSDEEEQGFVSEMFEWHSHSFRSVTDLKAKGINFSPSSHCLRDIRFDSYTANGKLQIPIWFVTNNTSALFSNMIAFEMSRETGDTTVTSYVNFMKSLIVTAKDVKELREKKILFSNLNNDDEVVRVFKEIEYGIGNVDFNIYEVKNKIDKHCNSKRKTWMAELIHTYFRSPWTVIALFAASVLLCLTFLQTFFTIWPSKKN